MSPEHALNRERKAGRLAKYLNAQLRTTDTVLREAWPSRESLVNVIRNPQWEESRAFYRVAEWAAGEKAPGSDETWLRVAELLEETT